MFYSMSAEFNLSFHLIYWWFLRCVTAINFWGCVVVGVAQIFFCIFTPSLTLKMEAVCSSKMFDHTYCILNGVRTQNTIIYIIPVQDHIIAYWVSCTRDDLDTEQVTCSGDACDLCWDTAVLTGLLWFYSFLWDIMIYHFIHNYFLPSPFLIALH
jgi:hypothetical protein